MRIRLAASHHLRTTSRLMPIVLGPTLLIYFVIVGGTPTGELDPILRTISGLVGGILTVNYFVRAPQQADRFDRLVLLALLLFACAAALSQFPRQSFDAMLAATAFSAALFAARGILIQPKARTWLIMTLHALSLTMTVITASLWLPHLADWYVVSDGAAPRVGLSYPSALWGYRYDLALLLVILYPSWWVGKVSRIRIMLGVVIGVITAVLVVLSGSRTIWLAIGVATLVSLLPNLLQVARRHRASRIAIALTTVLAVAMVLAPGFGRALLERLASLDTITARVEMWTSLISAWLEHPLAGHGPGSFPWILQTTSYFDTNTWAPRHPDNVIFQLLPEAGLLGIAAIASLLSMAPAVWRTSSVAARWALLTFAISAVGTNPTEFVFLLVVAIAWLAYALPRLPRSSASEQRSSWQSTAIRFAFSAGAVIVMVAFASTTSANFLYSRAQTSIDAGNLPTARAALGAAIRLDPSMALYWRQRGIIQYLMDDTDGARRDLTIATKLNPSDDLAWRAMALTHAADNDLRAATAAIDAAIRLQRSDAKNLLAAAWFLEHQGRDSDSAQILSEVVQAWPGITGAPGWSELVRSTSTSVLLDEAAVRWARGDPSPAPADDQELWLAGLSNDPNPAIHGRGLSPELSAAYVAALQCAMDARDLLDRTSPADERRAEYWTVRVRLAANEGIVDHDALRARHLMTVGPPELQQAQATMNPLNEGAWWGYRRRPIFWPQATIQLPDPTAGSLRWMRLPHDAVEEAGLQARLPDC